MDERILPGMLTLLLVVVIFAMMWWGWRNKLKRQDAVAALPFVPSGMGEAAISVPGLYVVTTSAGDWLDRMAVHGLGIRTPAIVRVYAAGVVIERKGAQDIFIAKEHLREVGAQSGMAGKFVEKDGLVVIGWHLADTAVDTGFRTTQAGAKRPLMEALQALLPQEANGTAGSSRQDNEIQDVENQPVDHTDTPTAECNGKNN
ncbi:hypothetical protein [Arthrobacter sp.]|uniref:PH-like domain-containing protein n=1 Tax=Arthrobacter sp. TaxID=1667 RepID=UPI0026DEAAB2|nr:hypothetical protein [Arthrobacter sp.]MDO5752614.1 hypothetical protein [Arthrobacter sp.]